MSDVFIFLIGCLVSLMVLSAVGLLLWGAAHEPHAAERPKSEGSVAPSSARRLSKSRSRQMVG